MCGAERKIKAWLESLDDLSTNAFLLPPHQGTDSSRGDSANGWINDFTNNDVSKRIVNVTLEDGSCVRPDVVTGETEVVVTFDNGDYFIGQCHGSLADRSGALTKCSQADLKTFGRWKDGCLEGVVDIELNGGGGWKRSNFLKGMLHGLTREFEGAYGIKPSLRLKRVAFYHRNQQIGVVWKRLVGGSYLVGTVDGDTEEMCGRDVIYIYPDFKGFLRGHFERGYLVRGQKCDLVDAVIDTGTQVMHLIVTPGYGAVFSKDFSTHHTISRSPLLSDPLERELVQVLKSSLSGSEAGQGLFARTFIPENHMVALFNGVRRIAARNNGYDYEDDPTFEYRIRLNGDEDIDIPKECRSLEAYCATLGHKVNHSFRPNSRWARLEHPRFGLICAITALRDIGPGEEIFVNYGIKMSVAPMWYKQLWVDHLRSSKQMNNQDILDWCHRQYSIHGIRICLPL